MKKTEKTRQMANEETIFVLPFFMYAGAGRHILSFDMKRKYIKIS